MAYDEKLAKRVEAVVHDWPGMTPKKMFGGVGWLLGGNMCIGLWKDSLIVRCSPDEWPRLLREPHVGEFDVTGRSMRGWLMVRPAALTTPAALSIWIGRARDFVRTLPSKTPAAKSGSRAASRKSPRR